MHNIIHLIHIIGPNGSVAIIFAESGLFFGFFLPGDSLLFTAGLVASQGLYSIILLAVLCPLAAVAGDSVGDWFGRKLGDQLFAKNDSTFFKRHHLEKTKDFYGKYGTKTILLARFVPVVRTFAPIMAGVAAMRYRTFLAWNIAGGVLWTLLLLALGYFLGSRVHGINAYILPIISGIAALSLVPVVASMFRRT